MDKLSIIFELLGMSLLVALAIGIMLSVATPIEMRHEDRETCKDDRDEPQ